MARQKCPFLEDIDSDSDSDSSKPMQKIVIYPKGKKKVKHGDKKMDAAAEKISSDEEDDYFDVEVQKARYATKERALRRKAMASAANHLFSAEKRWIMTDDEDDEILSTGAEVAPYELDKETPMEPFNLDKEREEGYFDEYGHYIKYLLRNKKIKDPWLDSVGVKEKETTETTEVEEEEEDDDDPDEHLPSTSSKDVGIMKRRIAEVLEPGETVLCALRRLKGGSRRNYNNKKGKMSAETKIVFDQLTDDATRLLEENGDYNVYYDEREVFEREAEEGYDERLAQSKQGGCMN